MPTPKKGARLGGSPAHQKLILSNLAVSLIENRALTTTEAKAKLLQPYFEKLVTKAKRGDIHSRRIVAKKIHSKDAVYLLFDEIVPAMDSERQGGYTRLIRVGNRKGDNAPLMRIELVMEKVEKKAVVAAAEKTAKAASSKVEAEEVAEETTEVEEATAEAEEVTTEAEEATAEAAADADETEEVAEADEK
ncbi:50S ribosomal protein L17 [Schaalia sp. ZJ1691]|uniref:50S ribosomal protein L17 n=1 Tax=Schaalia sp. ZJ1691 TaxID=2709404 RepID=UPI0013EBA69E|nr:50S ribosomal protein L17 [Schaalia sp. ZJ1691]